MRQGKQLQLKLQANQIVGPLSEAYSNMTEHRQAQTTKISLISKNKKLTDRFFKACFAFRFPSQSCKFDELWQY